MTSLVWLRNDLRLTDNPALYRAAERGEGVDCVYVWCKEYVKRHSIAPVRVDFVRRNLLVLGRDLAKKNIRLHLLVCATAKDIPAQLLQLATTVGAGQLFFNAEYPLDEIERDKSVVAAFRSAGLETKRFHDRVLVPPGRVRNGQGEAYKVFTAYKRKWLEVLAPNNPTPLGLPAEQGGGQVPAPSEDEIDRLFAGEQQRDLSQLWPAGEQEARKRLTRFVATQIQDYKNQRDFPAEEATSSLSPYLAVGAISPRECLSAALAANKGEWDTGSEGVTCWISELVWRDFYQHLVVDFPEVCRHRAMQAHTEAFPWSRDMDLFQRWCEGRTGIPIVDAAMHQLNQTGWMHNRLRMVVAMFLTKNLQIDWRLGEDYFMKNLIDGDFAANNGGWQWSASTGTDAAPYFRIFNPFSQSARFDPEGRFIRKYLPQLEQLPGKALHQPVSLPDYPSPIVDLAASRKSTINLFAQLGRV